MKQLLYAAVIFQLDNYYVLHCSLLLFKYTNTVSIVRKINSCMILNTYNF